MEIGYIYTLDVNIQKNPRYFCKPKIHPNGTDGAAGKNMQLKKYSLLFSLVYILFPFFNILNSSTLIFLITLIILLKKFLSNFTFQMKT